MDFDKITNEATQLTADLVNEVLNWRFSAGDKIKLLVDALVRIGETYSSKIFEDVSRVFGSEGIKTVPQTASSAQVRQLATKIVRDSAFGIEAKNLTRDYFDNLFARNAEQAYKNAMSLDKHPTITRTMTGLETCEWCKTRAGSYSARTFTELPTEVFRRHDGCDCLIRLSGAGTRSHKLNNYMKKG